MWDVGCGKEAYRFFLPVLGILDYLVLAILGAIGHPRVAQRALPYVIFFEVNGCMKIRSTMISVFKFLLRPLGWQSGGVTVKR